MTPDEPAALLSDAELAHGIGVAWLKHQGYTDDEIETGMLASHRDSGCEFEYPNWQCEDEHGHSLHPEMDAVDEASLMAVFVEELLRPHIDALTAERDRFQRQGADLQASYDEHCDAEDALRTERDALRARLDAAEAGIAAEIERAELDYIREWPADLAARGVARGRRKGLKLAAKLLAEPDAARIVGES